MTLLFPVLIIFFKNTIELTLELCLFQNNEFYLFAHVYNFIRKFETFGRKCIH